MMPAYATGHVTRATASTLGRSFASARLTITCSSLMAARLPDQRNKTTTNLLRVLRHHGKSLVKIRSSSRSRQRRNGIIATIATKPQYEPSASGDRLAGYNLDRRCRVAVDTIDEEDQVVGHRHEDVTQDDGPERNAGPPET